MIKEKKEAETNKKNINTKKRLSVYDLIRKEKYIEQFKTLIEDTEKVGKIKTIPFSKNTFPMFVKPKKGAASKNNFA